MKSDALFGTLAILALVAGLVLWVFSGIHSSKKYGAAGRRSFFFNFLIFLCVVAILYASIVVPALDCRGFLCGLGEFLLFISLTGLVFVLWPFLFLAYVKTVLKKKAPEAKNEDKFDSEIV